MDGRKERGMNRWPEVWIVIPEICPQYRTVTDALEMYPMIIFMELTEKN